MVYTSLPLSLALLVLSSPLVANAAPNLRRIIPQTQTIPLIRRHQERRTYEENLEWLARQRQILEAKYGGSTSDDPQRRSTGTNLIVNVGADASYYGSVAVGTPAISYNVILDTGSADFWLADTNCRGCSNVPTFDPTTSSTFRNLSSDFSIVYGSGRAEGSLGQDFVQLAGFQVSAQTFAVADRVSTGLLSDPISGLMGLAWSSLSTVQVTPFWQALVAGGAWDEPVMAFQLTRFRNVSERSSLEPGGSFQMGSTNSSLYTGDIDYVNIPSGQQQYWAIPITSLTVGGNAISLGSGTASYGIVDTGTTLIAGPADVVANVYAQIPGSAPGTGQSQGYYTFPCSTRVSVSISFGSRTWTMSPDDFTNDQVSDSLCTGSIFANGQTNNGQSPGWIIGDAFLKNVYSVFRYDPPSVGFAELSSVAVAANGVDADIPSATIGSVRASATGTNVRTGAATATRTNVLFTSLVTSVMSLIWIFAW